jgi:CHASE3 domain sensor protein
MRFKIEYQFLIGIGIVMTTMELIKKIIEGLLAMFDEANELVKSFRAARDLLAQRNYQSVRLRGYCMIDQNLVLSTMHQ